VSRIWSNMSTINHPHAGAQTAKRSSLDRRSISEKPCASGRASRRHRAYVVVFVFAIFATGLAAKLAMSAAIAFNHFR
jgi:hypothetical protein